MNDVNTTATESAPAKKPAAKKVAAKRLAEGAKERAKKVSAAKKPAKKSSAPKEKTKAGLPLNTKLKFGTGPDGKPYSLKNSPKRDGSKAAKVWAKYSLPGTVQKQLDNGVTSLNWDLDKKFVVVAK